jgi:hypothetical protein
MRDIDAIVKELVYSKINTQPSVIALYDGVHITPLVFFDGMFLFFRHFVALATASISSMSPNRWLSEHILMNLEIIGYPQPDLFAVHPVEVAFQKFLHKAIDNNADIESEKRSSLVLEMLLALDRQYAERVKTPIMTDGEIVRKLDRPVKVSE